jgi:hypothetical protein
MHILGLILIFLGVLVSSGCKTTNDSGLKRVIGTNDLKPLTNASELKKHGLLTAGSRVCNAFLIGKTSVMTALHCLNSDPHAFVGFTFKSLDGKTSKVTDILFLDDKKDAIAYSLSEQYDAFYELDYGLHTSGEIEVRSYDFEAQNLVSSPCKIGKLLKSASAFEHGCDTKPKFSGSPVLLQGKVVGVHIGYNPKAQLNYASNVAQFNDDKADIVELEVDAELEWGHVRSPHVRSPHIRLPDISFSTDGLLDKLASQVTPNLADQAEREGWTKGSCRTTGAITAVATPLYGTICTAVGLSTAGAGIPPCLAWIAGASATLVEVVCTQLCIDRRLQDCK